MKTIFLTKFGSEIYGTNTPSSDTDIKGIFLPEAKEILLQRAPGAINKSTKTNNAAKNTSEDIDTEYYSLHKYMNLLLDANTPILDMLFAPEKFWIKDQMETDVWSEIQFHRKSFLHKNISPFVSYCRHQAAKYGVKGTRVASLRVVLDFLAPLEPTSKLGSYDLKTFVEVTKNEFIKITEIRNPRGIMEPHLEVNGRKIAFHCTVKYAQEIFQKIFDEYGHRALLAEKNEGVDWKALSHAVRVCSQAQELLLYHELTFPRPDADVLLMIKKGQLPYKAVAELIEIGMENVESATKLSTLPEEGSRHWAEHIIQEAYTQIIYENY